MSSTADQAKATFVEAVRKVDRPAAGPAIEHGPTAGRRPDRSVFMLTLDRIRPDPNQVRTQNKTAADEEVRELAESIKALGIENPLTVRYVREGDMYELVAGERRFTAAGLAGLEEVPVKVVDVDDATVRRLQLHENVHRANLTPLELADALQHLLQDGETPESLAVLLCKSPAYVQKALALARHVGSDAKQFIGEHGARFTSMDLLYDVAQLKEEQQLPLLRQVVELNLTRDEVRVLTAPLKQAAKEDDKPAKGRRPKSRPTVRTLDVPCGARVTVSFPAQIASNADCRLALEQAIELTKLTDK